MIFHNPVEIIFGEKCRNKILIECKDKNVILFCSSTAHKRFEKDENLRNLFSMPNVSIEYGFSSNPSIDEIESLTKKYKYNNAQLFIGIGGGSAMDVTKILSATVPAYKKNINLEDLLQNENLFKNFKNINTILVPTTAGTGSEVTPFATIWDFNQKKKKSLSSQYMYAKKAFIDPDFLINTPKEISLTTGLDALNQAFESIWNKNANSITTSIAINASKVLLTSLPQIDNINNNKTIRNNLMLGSVLAGMAISQTRTSICHSISYPLTIKHDIDHGLACAFSMIAVYKFNKPYIEDSIKEISTYLNEDPLKVIAEIFENHKVHNKLKSKLPDIKIFTSQIDEFIAEGRFDNNIIECKPSNLKKIIIESFKAL
jgi:alcohol dehydrogenase